MSAIETVTLRVWGEYACFTRPEMKVERVSYPVMTPSAARGVLESVFWKPEFQWRVMRIVVLRPIKHFSLRRNETGQKVAPRSVSSWMEEEEHESFLIDEHRVQRHTLGLRDVAYRIDASVALPEGGRHGDYVRYREQFLRRARRGQCYMRPYLGCREFAAWFSPADGSEAPIDATHDLGYMLFDVRYDPESGRGEPVFFEARLESGCLEVPQELYEEVNG